MYGTLNFPSNISTGELSGYLLDLPVMI